MNKTVGDLVPPGEPLPEHMNHMVQCSHCQHILPLKDVEICGDCMVCPNCGEFEELWEEARK